MKHSLQRMVRLLLSVTTTLSLVAFGTFVQASIGTLASVSATLTDVQAGNSSNYTIQFNVASTTALKGMTFQFTTTPSGAATEPYQMSTSSATLGQVKIAGTDVTTAWSIDASTNGDPKITNTSGSGALVTGNTVIVTLNSIANNTLSGTLCGTNANADTCYIRVTTYSDTGVTTVVDQSVTSYTIINPVTVTATVDPILTFTVAGVTNTNIATNDTNAPVTSANTVTTTATTIPFGHVAVGTAAMGQQSLTVLTNANFGYNVYQKFNGTTPSTDMMTGTYSGNNIDPAAASWSSPATWVTPTGTTASVNSGLLGVRTSNGGVANFNSSNVYAGPYVGTGIGNAVMTHTTPDDGTTPTYVTYKLQVDPYQPADVYTGVSVYNVVASY